MRNYGIYEQGAIIKNEDFDPVKVILAVCEKICNITLPDNIKSALQFNIFSRDIAVELCEMLDIDIEDSEEIQDYSYLSNTLLEEADSEEWFDGPDSLMGTSEISVNSFTDIEGEFVYDNQANKTEYIDALYMFSLYVPFVWDIGEYNGCRTKDETAQKVREAAKPLLKDAIDWNGRLGYLIGSSFG
jgi:hypothetical protein